MFSTTFDKSNKLWHGNNIPPLYNPRVSVAQALLNSLTQFGPKIAQISDNNGVRMTFDEIKTKTVRAAQNLQALGYRRKQVFALVARNSHHVAPITFASIAIGCPVNTIDATFGRVELNHMFGITKPVLVFCDIDCYESVVEVLAELKNDAKIFTFGGKIGQSEPVENLFRETNKEDQFIPVQVDGPNEVAMIVCSSGTTGLPKGVCISHASLLDNHSKRSDVCSFSDIMLNFASLYWISGLGILIRGTLVGATRLITTETFSPELMLRLIEQYKVTYSMHSPHQITLLMKCDRFKTTDFSSLKYLLVGGSKVPLKLKTEMSNNLPNGNLYVGYGMSEIGGSIAYDYPNTDGKDVVGRILDGLCIKIIDDHGNRCSELVDGEICIKNRYKFLGYYNNKRATDECIDDEGFIQTGDVGHFDENGNLCITGRKKELLKYYNFQISPVEIDAFLCESPDIKTACVVGMPDDVAPDLPAAVVVRNQGSTITEQEVFDMVADHFADHYKLRGGVYFVDSIPTTASGKVLRRKAKETAIEMHKNSNRNSPGHYKFDQLYLK